jgi:hypothetical protein
LNKEILVLILSELKKITENTDKKLHQDHLKAYSPNGSEKDYELLRLKRQVIVKITVMIL